MSAMTDRVSADLKAALKEHRPLELSVYRMLKSELQKFQADKGLKYVLTDDDVITIVTRLVKQRLESAEQFKAAGATDRAEEELAESEVLRVYLPAPLSEEELTALVRDAITSTGAASMKDMGRVMGAVMPKVKGRAGGKLVQKVVMTLLKQA